MGVDGSTRAICALQGVVGKRLIDIDEVHLMPDHKDKLRQPQIDKFHDLAREVEAYEDEKRFEDQVRRIARKSCEPAFEEEQEARRDR